MLIALFSGYQSCGVAGGVIFCLEKLDFFKNIFCIAGLIDYSPCYLQWHPCPYPPSTHPLVHTPLSTPLLSTHTPCPQTLPVPCLHTPPVHTTSLHPRFTPLCPHPPPTPSCPQLSPVDTNLSKCMLGYTTPAQVHTVIHPLWTNTPSFEGSNKHCHITIKVPTC